MNVLWINALRHLLKCELMHGGFDLLGGGEVGGLGGGGGFGGGAVADAA